MNTNHKIILKKGASIAAAAMIGLTSVACGTTSGANDSKVTAKQQVAEKKALETAVTSTSFGDSNEKAEKVETVYVNSDAEGANDKVIVSEWLRNYQGDKSLNDKTDLKNIQNVKGNETYIKNSDGSITWNAGGNDIYYQGKTNTELPVNVKVSYKLDGKSIEPKDLAGKSGKVTIRFDYVNNAKEMVTINGQQEEVTVPFAMLSGVILPTDTFTNVSVTNGKVVSDANKNIVVGAALPGLKESLQLNQDKLDELNVPDDISIPEYVEITADTKDFELGMTMTMASCDVLSDLGLSDLDNSTATDKLKSDMDTLTSSMNSIVDGSGKLTNGSKDLKNGLDTLYAGTKTLKSGTDSLSSKTPELIAGVNKVNDGAKALNDGATSINNGASQLVAGYTGDEGAVKGSANLAAGIKSVPATIKSGGESQVVKSVKAALVANSAELTGLSSLGILFTGMVANPTTATIGQTCGGYLAKVSTDAKKIMSDQGDAATVRDLEINLLALDQSMQTNKATIIGFATAAGVPNASDMINGTIVAFDKMLIGSTAAGASQTGLTSAVASLDAIDGIYNTLSSGDGVYQSQLVAGADKLAAGINKLYEGTSLLKDGSAKLLAGTTTLTNGTAALASGANALGDGATKLSDGVDSLNDGAKKLDDGSSTLYSGMKTLNEGLVKFDNEGVKKLSEAFNGDIQSFANRLKAVDDASKSYKSFAGVNDDMSSSVKFMIETSSIKAEK